MARKKIYKEQTRLHIYIEKDLKTRAKIKALKEGVSLTKVIPELLEKYYLKEEENERINKN